jgi:hypothetical protein
MCKMISTAQHVSHLQWRPRRLRVSPARDQLRTASTRIRSCSGEPGVASWTPPDQNRSLRVAPPLDA